MGDEPSGRVTRLLREIEEGRAGAEEALLPLVYDELRRLARARLAREREGGHRPTSLVHEAYLRLVGDTGLRFENRAHFFSAAAEAMRRIAIERARFRARLKRGGDRRAVPLDEDAARIEARPEELLDLDRALARLDTEDAPMALVVKLRYFAGLSVEETAEALGSSPRTVKRQWAAARAWLYDALDPREPGGD